MDGIIAMLPAPLQRFSSHHDYPGQKYSERIYQVILVVAGVIGFFVGWSTQQLSHAIYIVLAGAVLASLIVLPPWPCFRRHPLKWQTVTVEPKTDESDDNKKSK